MRKEMKNEKERRSRQVPHKVHLEREHQEWSFREHPPSYGEMIEDGARAAEGGGEIG